MKREEALTKTNVGLAGAIIVLAQVVSGFSSTKTISGDIDHLRKDLKRIQAKQESMNRKLAHMNVEIKSMRKDYASLEGKKLFAWKGD